MGTHRRTARARGAWPSLIGYAFVALAVYVTVQASYTLIVGDHPGHSTLGIAWTAATCIAMLALGRAKASTWRALGNPSSKPKAA